MADSCTAAAFGRLTAFSLLFPDPPERCAERLRAVIGPSEASLASTYRIGDTFAAYGTVTPTSITRCTEPASLLGRRDTPAILQATLTPDKQGTRIDGSVELPGWVALFVVAWVVVACSLALSQVVDAIQAATAYGPDATPVRWPLLLGSLALPFVGLLVIRVGEYTVQGEAERLIGIVTKALDATSAIAQPSMTDDTAS